MRTSPIGHKPPELVDRRTFNAAFVRVLLAAGFVSRCGSNPTSPSSPAAPNTTNPPGSVVGAVSANHPAPHVAIITASQLAAAAPIVVGISNGMHSHTLTVTGEQLTQIAAGMRVSITSSTDPHSDGTGPHNHEVTFN